MWPTSSSQVGPHESECATPCAGTVAGTSARAVENPIRFGQPVPVCVNYRRNGLAFKLLRLGTMNETYGQVVSLAEVTLVRIAVTNRRCEVRRRPDEVRWLRSARLKYGRDVESVDISPNGILIRSDREFSANDPAVLELSTTTGKCLVIARVVRSRKITASPSAWFETAFRFKRPLETEKFSSPTDL